MNTPNLEYQRLTKEDMEKRGILGRLVGVCADFISPTRNGRKYPEALWENVFTDPIMTERIENGVCYGELGHPADREETDMEKIAVCLAEVPQKGKDGKLRAVFDILNTPNGRILKSLCDYGSTLGISSRGSGDLETDFDGQESVNPDTYNCEGFDVVLIPAVKEARLQYVTESLNKTRYNKTLRDKLQESINKEDEKHQKIMMESLGALGIRLEEGTYDYDKVKDEFKDYLLKNGFKIISERTTKDCTVFGISRDGINRKYRLWTGKIKLSDHIDKFRDYWETLTNTNVAEDGNTSVPIQEEQISREEAEREFLSLEDAYANGEEVDIDRLNALDKYIRTLEQTELEDNKHKYDDFKGSHYVEELNNQETDDIDEVTESIAVGSDKALVEELQNAIKLLKDYERQIVSLQEKLSVCYAKETKLNEDIDNFKSRVQKLSKFRKENIALQEKLDTVNKDSVKANQKLSESLDSFRESEKTLKESIENKDSQIKSLREKLNTSRHDLRVINDDYSKLKEKYEIAQNDLIQLKEQYSTKYNRERELAEKYQRIAKNSVNRYIESQAVRLGVKSSEIKNRLPESYNFNDIDAICEDLQEYKLNMSHLPFSPNSMRMNESIKVSAVNSQKPLGYNTEDEITDLELRLAGLV